MNNDYGNELLHKVLLSAMKDIDKICRENNLKYYLHAGTLLGAVNHKGFIPWDDDVDITIKYEDYKRLLEIIREEYSDRYYVQGYFNDDNYSNNRAKLRIKHTRLIEYGNSNETNNEIFIDIAPLYYSPKSQIMRFLQRSIIEAFDAVVLIKLGDIIPTSLISKYILYPLSKINRRTIGRIVDWTMIAMQNTKSEYLGTLCYVGVNPYTGKNGYENDMIRRECYEKPVYLPFEDTQFMTISDWHKDLIRRYGEHYMDPYPEEKRVTKHNICDYYIGDEVKKRIGL